MIIFNRQLESRHPRQVTRQKRKRLIFMSVLACVLITFFSSGTFNQPSPARSSEEDIIVNTNDLVTLPEPYPASREEKKNNATAPKPRKSMRWLSFDVKPGDNLSLIFQRNKIPKPLLNEIIRMDKKDKILPKLKPGQTIKFGERDSELITIVIEIDKLSSIRFEKVGEELISRVEVIEPTLKLAAASAIIQRSLYLDGQKAGLSDSTIMQLTEIFAWDIDFALDLRPGDTFSVIYEQIYKGSEFLGNGKILAANFINKGKIKRAVRYPLESEQGTYFNQDGQAMRKAFLRTPVEYSRISSRFSLKRKHPILNKIRAHTGVDYAASLGTPVRATSDGRVKNVGWNGGYGKTIVLNHGSRYSTLYAHLARYNRKIKPGTYVKQGQIIGYVGKTGLATGPHLHYEFRLDGKHKNPLTVKFPPAKPIKKELVGDFVTLTQPFFKHLELLTLNTSNGKIASRENLLKTPDTYERPSEFLN